MGEVYEVQDRFLQGVHVALKMILPEIAEDAGSSHRFEQEVLLARKVSHPNLCPIYDIARSDDPPPAFLFLTMKLLAGETLSSRLRRGHVPREEAVAIFRQMVSGIGAIHAAGVIHRDIKPNNVMLDHSGAELCLSIMDFGLARLHELEATMPTRSLLAGTPGYMAPEVLNGQGPSRASDIFALGVLLHQVLTGDRPQFGALNLSVQPSPALNTADVPAIFIQTVKEFLSNEPKRRCAAFEQIEAAQASPPTRGGWASSRLSDSLHPKLLSRRQFAVGSALAAGAAAGGVAWNWDRLNNFLHPLPGKRFVALLGWPPPAEAHLASVIGSVVDAIGSELARAEAFDHDLLIIPHGISKTETSFAQLNDLRESLGANLVLAASGAVHSGGVHLLLRILDPASTRTLREKTIAVPRDEQLLLPEKAVKTAAGLLDVKRYKPDAQRSSVGTDNLQAYAAFQAAESLMKQDNDTGLDAAIEKYKQAIEIDPRYALTNAELAWAYCRLYAVRKNTSALSLAQDNCTAALALNPQLVEGHLALASVYEYRGDRENAFRETTKALAIDPSNPKTLVYQAQFYSRSNRWNDAEATFQRVLKIRPNYWWAHHELGVLYNSEGRYPEALNQFRAVTLEMPKSAIAFSNVGSVYLQQGKVDEAVTNLTKSLALEPTDYAASTMAAALRAEGRYPEAVEFAKKAVSLNPEEGENWLELGDCYSLLPKRQGEALEAYKRCASLKEQELQTNPASGPDWMILALARVKSGFPETAPSLIERAERLSADDLDSQLYKVRILELLGRRVDAVETAQRCFARGATLFQLRAMPDMGALLSDSRLLTKISDSGSAK